MPDFSFISHLSCSSCHRSFSADILLNTCSCGHPLIVNYRIDDLKKQLNRSDIDKRAKNLWRFHELLPVKSRKSVISLEEGYTPLIPLKELGRQFSLSHLFLKNEAMNPGGTFKARGATVGLSKAKELGVRKIALATNGNAGEAWALYGAKAKIDTTILMPKDAQDICQKLCYLSGAKVFLVDGLISDGGAIIQRQFARKGWFDVSTLKEPYRLEGKKTIIFEIVQQMGWRFPDAIIFPTGGGISLAATYKGLQEIQELGWAQGSLPRLIAVQPKNCCPFEHAFLGKRLETQFYENAQTIANGLRVPKSFCDRLVLEAIYNTDGYVCSVTDKEMLDGIQQLSQYEGIYLCPEAGAAISALKKLYAANILRKKDRVVILGSGCGIKYSNMFALPKLQTLKKV